MSGSENKAAKQSDKKRYSGSFVVIVAVSIGLISFVLGTRGEQLLSLVGPHLGIHSVVGSLDLSTVQETYRKLAAEYAGDIDQQKMIESANKAIVEAVDDPYTEYFTASEAQQYNNDLSGNIGGGIGAELGVRSDRVTVLELLDNSPAGQAGVKVDDVILKVNGQSTKDESLTEVVDKIRGEVGTTVKLSLGRGQQTVEVSVTRSQITAPDIDVDINDNIGIIEVSRFDKDTGQNIRSSAEELKKQAVDGVIIDLRGNGGGYLEAAVGAAGVWLNNKVVVVEQKNNVTQETFKSTSNPVLEGVPTVVLIDGGSASASEILAGALHDHQAATLIGTQSYGKGSVQALIGLSGGAELKVTVAKWQTPKGVNINQSGIEPDKTVELSQKQLNAGQDPQLEAAFKHLKP